MEIHKKNYIHHDLHSGNIFSDNVWDSRIGDLGLCQQVVDKKESDIYSFGMIIWEFTTGKKPFHDRPHNHCLILDILKGERPQITDDTPEFYAKLMKKCWDHNPENRPTAEEIWHYLRKCQDGNKIEIIVLAETKRQEIIKSNKFLSDTESYKHHPES